MPLWLDLIASPRDWASSFLSEEAREVLAVIGGLVLVFALPAGAGDNGDAAAAAAALAAAARELIREVGRVVRDGLGGWEWDGVGLAVGVGEGPTDEWDELCAEAGLEFVQVTGREEGRRNEFGGIYIYILSPLLSRPQHPPSFRESQSISRWAMGLPC